MNEFCNNCDKENGTEFLWCDYCRKKNAEKRKLWRKRNPIKNREKKKRQKQNKRKHQEFIDVDGVMIFIKCLKCPRDNNTKHRNCSVCRDKARKRYKSEDAQAYYQANIEHILNRQRNWSRDNIEYIINYRLENKEAAKKRCLEPEYKRKKSIQQKQKYISDKFKQFMNGLANTDI